MATAKKKAAPRKRAAAKKKPATKKPAAKKKKALSAAAAKSVAPATIQPHALRPVGRPPKTITQTALDKVRTLAAQGCSKRQCAAMLGMGESTYLAKQVEYPELSEAFDLGRQQGITAVAGALYTKALVGDVAAMRYWLNNKDAEEWQEKRLLEAGENLSKSIASMRPEDRLDLINQKADEATA